MTTLTNREHWLNKGVEKLVKEFFAKDGLDGFEQAVKISVGWCRGNKKAIGQCWSKEFSEDGSIEIFISPALSNGVEVLATILHELIHAHLGNGKGHGKEFTRIARGFGLEGRVTATFASEGSELHDSLKTIVDKLGAYPHKKLIPMDVKSGAGKNQPNWPRYKSINADDYRCIVSPRSIENYGVPKDQWGDDMIPTK